MSALVFGGAAQLVALEVWANPLTLWTVVSLAVVTGIVNARFILMGATLRPWFGALPQWQAYAALNATVDATWLIAVRYRAEGGSDASVFVGAGNEAGYLDELHQDAADARQRGYGPQRGEGVVGDLDLDMGEGLEQRRLPAVWRSHQR